ncbi:hypothetical protein BDA99DRAFT_537895 [Phascolomyces articulosus]|uniref:F-box domain-containing protein n=1 Tax=Phascolomyces articulosus TaxID=60185 RepID=A0AAD5PDN5_9FUNG|nr:hypothetical protein BDA99DRAFT_537895 [Phascolomyces articulosus]
MSLRRTRLSSTCHQDFEQRIENEAKLIGLLDPLVQLPSDIVCRVIDYVPQDTVAQCALLSSAWRSFILGYPNPWRSMGGNYLSKFGTLCCHCYRILRLVTHHVEDLELSATDRSATIKPIKLLDEFFFFRSSIADIGNQLSRLSNLSFEECRFDTSELKQTITTFAENTPIPLQRITISPDCKGVDEETKVICAGIQSLTDLTIELGRMNAIGIKAFVQGISRLPLLYNLDTGCTNMNMEDLHTISANTSLCFICIVCIGEFSIRR